MLRLGGYIEVRGVRPAKVIASRDIAQFLAVVEAASR
jgi:hypothetical protein